MKTRLRKMNKMQCTRTTMRKMRGSRPSCVMTKMELPNNYLSTNGNWPCDLVSEPILLVGFNGVRSAVMQLMLSSPDFKPNICIESQPMVDHCTSGKAIMGIYTFVNK